MGFNNAVDATQQGVQYLSTTGAWSGVDANTAGFLLTSNGTGIAPSFQSLVTTGTWTPTLTFGGSSTGITYSTQFGAYVKVGKMCFITWHIVLTSKGAQTGAASISTLPATPQTVDFPGEIPGSQSGLTAAAANYDSHFLLINSGSTTADIWLNANGFSATPGPIDDTFFTNPTAIGGSGVFLCN